VGYPVWWCQAVPNVTSASAGHLPWGKQETKSCLWQSQEQSPHLPHACSDLGAVPTSSLQWLFPNTLPYTVCTGGNWGFSGWSSQDASSSVGPLLPEFFTSTQFTVWESGPVGVEAPILGWGPSSVPNRTHSCCILQCRTHSRQDQSSVKAGGSEYGRR
jgi:hypothetical protein